MAASMQVAGVPLRELLARIEKASGRRIGTSEAELLGGFTECDVQPWRPPPIRAGERRKTCPVCAFSWLDRWKKDECPKCLNSLSHSSRLASGGGARRVPGEVSTFKQPPSSAMEYLSGQCKWGGAHLWRFGRCSKCGLAEGSRRGVVDSSYAPLRLSNSAADSSSGAHSGALGRSSSTPALRPAPPVLAWGAGPLATPESAAAGPILESEMVNQCDAAGQDWELLLTTRNGAAEHAISRLQPTSLPNSHARLTRPSSVQSLGAPSWRGAPIRRPMKSSQLGLDQVYRKPDVGETRRECPVCAFRWLDKYGKDECPKCLVQISMPDWRRNRRLPGEVSTFKQPPGSAMESESGVCRAGGSHVWKFGRCRKCGVGEGRAIEEAQFELKRAGVYYLPPEHDEWR